MRKENDFRVTSWGVSMYGGWYVNYYNNGEYSGVSGRILSDCLKKLNITRADLRNRFDN